MQSAHLGLAFLLLVTACGGDDDSDGAQTDAAAGDGADAAPGGGDAATQDAAANDGGTEADASTTVYPVQLIRPSCSPPPPPLSRPSIRVLLGDEPTGGETCAVDDTRASVTVEVFTRDIVAPMTFNFGTSVGGRGSYCAGGDAPCREYDIGSITFDTYEAGVGASGSWRLVAEGVEDLTGRFDGEWCEPDPPELCGPLVVPDPAP
jgi:hypothetical protein